ncbi:gas vesicle protein K [Patescibacteria group bacterium]|nr:gas vesicle protein K [Candidatus Falkowbacteria bacterium]MBU3906023.1 gas vesicle protein K [Patescibacteria group bacterium]MCG2695771.1 gas vesicle protein K [Candidatus Parcubacteria bacterium]MBU4015096.1 gas vesicle protein K [Patescibacteria group bacterium]MBU4026782.1 gas vesicle protein K [Patescibacteria group bacterium]
MANTLIILSKPKEQRVTLIDALDKVLEKGAVINGDVAIRVADVDLIYLGLRVLLTSISKVEEMSGKNWKSAGTDYYPSREPTKEDLEYIAKLEQEIKRAEASIPKLIDADNPQKAEQGIAKLVLTLVELLRRLMEKEVIRRMQKGSLSNTEIQKLGMTFKAMEKKMQELKTVFGIEDEELNLDLGPLGNLM